MITESAEREREERLAREFTEMREKETERHVYRISVAMRIFNPGFMHCVTSVANAAMNAQRRALCDMECIAGAFLCVSQTADRFDPEGAKRGEYAVDLEKLTVHTSLPVASVQRGRVACTSQQ